MKNTPVMQQFLNNYEGYRRLAKSIAKGNEYIAEEIIQDTYLILSRRTSPVDNPKTWIYLTIKNSYLNSRSLKKNKIFENTVCLSEVKNEHFNKDTKTPYDELKRKQIIEKIKLNTSKNRKKDVIVRMMILDGLNFIEIAQLTGLSNNTINSHVKVNKRNGDFDWLKELI